MQFQYLHAAISRTMAICSGHDAFRYQPLEKGHIRLLRISKEEGELIYTLSHFDLASTKDRVPPYAALSYTWKNQPRNQDHLVNDSVLKIIRNVKTFLPYLARIGGSQHFWIDSICINQDDEEEKKVQILLMGEIYSRATKGLIWMSNRHALWDRVIPEIPALLQRFEGYDFQVRLNDHDLEMRGLPTLSSPLWRYLHVIFLRKWFTRVWTFQESVLPNVVEFVFGEHCISFAYIAKLARILLNASTTISIDSMTDLINSWKAVAQAGMERILMAEAFRKQPLSGTSTEYAFPTLLAFSRNWQSSKQLDKIYGLLGLADQFIREKLTVDYSKSSEEVCLELARLWISQDSHLEIFNLASPSRRKGLSEFPKWCPSFSDMEIEIPFGMTAIWAKYCAGFLEGEGFTCALSLDSDLRVVHVLGFHVDEVAEALPYPWERQSHGIMGIFRNLGRKPKSRSTGVAESMRWERKCLELSQHVYNKPHEIPDEYWRTLIADKHASGQRFTGNGRESYHLMRIKLSTLVTDDDWLSDEEKQLASQPLNHSQLREMQDFVKSLHYSVHGRSFFTTKCGRIGLGPSHTKSGDLVCIFYNGYTPFIIRSSGEALTCINNEFIGEAYVDGLMYGEALKMEERSPDMVFTLE